jgi:hypothetical protein
MLFAFTKWVACQKWAGLNLQSLEGTFPIQTDQLLTEKPYGTEKPHGRERTQIDAR